VALAPPGIDPRSAAADAWRRGAGRRAAARLGGAPTGAAAAARALPAEALPADAVPAQWQPADSLPPDSIPADSLPPDSMPPDSLPPDTLPPGAIGPGSGRPKGGEQPAAHGAGRVDGVDKAHDLLLGALAAESQPSPADAAFAALPTIAQIGRYALKRRLGTGGAGHVHEAWDPLLSRTVAIKTLHFHAEGPTRDALDRLFLNEVRAVASLSHPHIVTVYDAGLAPQGVYLAMERLHGCDLRARLAGGWHPSPGQAAHLVRRLADALAYAHARGVVHCDIKPGNVFLTANAKPWILDFGIARVAHARAVDGMEGWVVGSPHYLAPEQLRGEPVDARTDVYALGVLFYELLAGRKAFVGDSIEQVTTAVLANHPAPANELRSGVSPTLALIAAHAMARDPADRYPTASEMAAELRRWLERHTRRSAPRRPDRTAQTAPAAEGADLAAGASPASGAMDDPAGPARGWPGPSDAQDQPDPQDERMRRDRRAHRRGASMRRPLAMAAAAATLLMAAALAWTGTALKPDPADPAPGPGPVVLAAGVPAPVKGVASAPSASVTPAHPVGEAAAAAAAAPAVADAVTSGAAPGSAPGAAPRPAPGVAGGAAAGVGPAVAGAADPAAAAMPTANGAPALASTPRAAPTGTPGATPARAEGAATGPKPGAATPPREGRPGRDKPDRRSNPGDAARAGPAAASPPSAPAATGTLQLAISPWGQVEINGQGVGTTPPLTRLTLPQGTHQVTVRNADFPPLQVTVQVHPDQAVTLRHRFAP
jgi:serine/threonine-protein kinase